MTSKAFCRDCLESSVNAGRCPKCCSPRVVSHPELFDLPIAHVDCDAFYASIEKRDDPALLDKPVIVGGGKRGVVATACYIARIHGVHSAMPMFQARKLCPEAVVVRPRMKVYAEVSRQIRELMDGMTPLVEPLSLDEAFLDLSGTSRLHGEPPAMMLARLANKIEREFEISVSVGLSHCKFLAKIASDLEKPRGFSVIGRSETSSFLAQQPVGLIWGVGRSTQRSLSQAGIYTIQDLRNVGKDELVQRFGVMGDRLWNLAHGRDQRSVRPQRSAKSLSNELTFSVDTNRISALEGHLWRLTETVAGRAKIKGVAGKVVTLKVKTANHKILTRQVRLPGSTQSAEEIYGRARGLLDRVVDRGPFRLIGVGISDLEMASSSGKFDSSLDLDMAKLARTERATDVIRAKFGKSAIMKGRSFR